MAVFCIHDLHKQEGHTHVERISLNTENPEYALEVWWAYSKRNDGGPVDTDRYEARREQ